MLRRPDVVEQERADPACVGSPLGEPAAGPPNRTPRKIAFSAAFDTRYVTGYAQRILDYGALSLNPILAPLFLAGRGESKPSLKGTVSARLIDKLGIYRQSGGDITNNSLGIYDSEDDGSFFAARAGANICVS